MNTKTEISKTAGKKVKPSPRVHAASEPEYDAKILAERASRVTDVLENILHERPAEQVKLPPKLPIRPPPAPPV
ncbi:MAG TPA: hypothetical protein DCY13_23135 [Verrucomicrobiales bacterium]|nr:hypothetical protein [Verrucomicrobiales bacterium]